MSLKEDFEKILTEYDKVFRKVWEKQEFKDPLFDFFNTELKQEVYSIVSQKRAELVVDSSTGVGRTTITPWITIMDTRITSKA